MHATPSSRSSARAVLKALLLGLVVAIAHYAVMRIVRVTGINLGQFGRQAISLSLFFLGGLTGGVIAGRHEASMRSAAMAYGALLIGIAIGVLVWNGLEDHLFSQALSQDRKLSPVDIMLLWMLGWAPLLVGLAAGMFFGASRRQQ